MNIVRFQKIVLKNDYEDLKVGNVYEVARITDDKVIVRTEKEKLAVAAIDIDNFNNLFKPYENAVGKWTKWIPVLDAFNGLLFYYKTNYKRVTVKSSDGKYKGKASCNYRDNFDIDFGIRLACARMLRNSLKAKLKAFDDVRMLSVRDLESIEKSIQMMQAGRISTEDKEN